MVIYTQIDDTRVMAQSDAGLKIHGGYPEADYDFAIDPIAEKRTYTETDKPINPDVVREQKAAAYELLVNGGGQS